MSAIKKAIAKVPSMLRSPSESPKSTRRELSPSPPPSESPTNERRSRVQNIIHQVRSKSISSATSARTRKSSDDTKNHPNVKALDLARSQDGPHEVQLRGGPELDRKLSMTEMREERRTDRQMKDEDEQEKRRKLHEEAWKNDPLHDKYGDLPLNQSQFPRSQPLMGLPAEDKDVTLISPLSGIIRASEDELVVANGHAASKTLERHIGDSKVAEINGDARRAPSSASSASTSLVSSPGASTDNLEQSNTHTGAVAIGNGSTQVNGKTTAQSNGNRQQQAPDHEHDDEPIDVSKMRMTPLKEIEHMSPGTRVAFRARVHHIRALGSKIVFLVLRSQLTTVQAVLTETPDRVSQNMVRWAEGLSRETIVRVVGRVEEPPREEGQDEVRSATVHKREIKVEMLHVIAKPTAPLPFQVDAVHFSEGAAGEDGEEKASKTSRGSNNKVGDRTRLANRVLDLRTPASQAIFIIHAATVHLFRTALLKRGFTEIHSSKFDGSGGSEAGAAVFKVDYFRRPAFLAQSPQLAKQMCIAADMERVFEVGPVFRAENSNTHRHLTEFTGLDLEMAIDNHYHEVLDVIDDTLKTIFKGLQKYYREEIEIVKQVFPSEDIVVLDETPRIKFADGIRMLREAGFKNDDGSEPKEDEDLSTAAEKRLGALVKEKYGADYYILDKFPIAARPFYTMPDPENPKFTNSFDIFVRGEEILSGGQRIHHAPMLEERMKACGVDPENMIDYLNGFKWGCPPHGGGGVGLERIVMLFLRLGDVRWASLFPRDPKSFATNGQDPVEASMAAATAIILKGPESKTYQPGQPHGDMPPLENLIAKYGDATNTSWVDPAWTVWRDEATGAAVGYMPSGHFAVIFGNPLCESHQIPRVVNAFLAYLRSDAVGLKPIWCCIDAETERYLAQELGWSAVIAVAEERLNPIEIDPANNDKTVRRKIHRAEREGVKVHEVDGEPDAEVKRQIEERCKDWSASRKGTQIHLTGVRPFDDVAHRKYFYATDKEGKICSLVVLAQLAPVHGFQIKWALEFPDAPLGAIEYILLHVIRKLGDAGVRTATFGAGAAQRLQGVDNVGGFRIRTLEKTYNGLSHTFHLSSKGDFRGKFGIEQDPLYICYPKGSLGVRGVEAIMSVLQKPK